MLNARTSIIAANVDASMDLAEMVLSLVNRAMAIYQFNQVKCCWAGKKITWFHFVRHYKKKKEANTPLNRLLLQINHNQRTTIQVAVLTPFVNTMKIVHQRNYVIVWIDAVSIHAPSIRVAKMLTVHQLIMGLIVDAWTVSPETPTLNAIKFKVVEVIQNVVIVRRVLMENVRRHANAVVLLCVKYTITKLRANVQMDIRAMHASAVVHHRIHVNQIHAAWMPCVSWIAVIRFASVQRAWLEIHLKIAVSVAYFAGYF